MVATACPSVQRTAWTIHVTEQDTVKMAASVDFTAVNARQRVPTDAVTVTKIRATARHAILDGQDSNAKELSLAV